MALGEWTLWLHIAAGVVAVAAGVGALATTKGGTWHRRAGKLFVASMAAVVATTLLLLAVAPSGFRVFLALVAVFSGYLAFSGYRVLARKRPDDGPKGVDWAAALLAAVASLALGGWGALRLLEGGTFGVVMVAFGGIGVAFGAGDLWLFRSGGTDAWLVTHLQRMLAAFIATVSAVSAVNLTAQMGVLAWLWPTLVGVPLIAYWSQKYERD
ncbi:hypothetical protein [Halorarius halobius]|uniref:hypothetical protein n=1 Tax=Halorarius halobius TaxID=2962671 RepID=UPI0020CC1A7B|nr:hypothetical protein [Halorarius halobius]